MCVGVKQNGCFIAREQYGVATTVDNVLAVCVTVEEYRVTPAGAAVGVEYGGVGRQQRSQYGVLDEHRFALYVSRWDWMHVGRFESHVRVRVERRMRRVQEYLLLVDGRLLIWKRNQG